MEKDQAKKVVEALLYMTDHPLTEDEILEVIGEKELTTPELRDLIKEVAEQYDASGSPLSVVDVAGGVQIATRAEIAPWIKRLYRDRLTVRLSTSALETLSIIAYKQPITRSDIEQIRGVEVTGVMETLLERRLIKVVGRKETIGRPLLYGTTIEFLRQFGIKHLAELPDLATLAASIPAPELPGAETPGEGEPEEVLATPDN